MSLVHQIYTKSALRNSRSLFYWVNQQFNVVDEERKKLLGSDRTCAEWILRNGGKVKYAKNSNEATEDYNELPKEEESIHLTEIDASNTLIMDNGFEHLDGCKFITKATFDQCAYLNDVCLEKLQFIQNSLLFLQVSRCEEVTEQGMLHLPILKKLKTLVVFSLPKVKDTPRVLETLKIKMPQCNIKFSK